MNILSPLNNIIQSICNEYSLSSNLINNNNTIQAHIISVVKELIKLIWRFLIKTNHIRDNRRSPYKDS